jgi:hypothetical protein
MIIILADLCSAQREQLMLRPRNPAMGAQR